MADAAISATVKVVLGTVISTAADRIGMVLGVKKELERLSKTAAMIQGFLADADEKMHTPGVREWLKQLEDEVFKADNVLDELNYDNLRREVKYRNQPIKKKVCFFFSFFNAIGFSSSLASKIRDIHTNLEGINQEAINLGLVEQYQNEAALAADAIGARTSRQTDSIVVPNVVGRAGDESKIVEMLLTPSERVVSIIPITGMGGLGKTTLAKSVYNNKKIDENFGIRSWVCMAREIQIVELFKLILESLTRKKVEVDGRDAIIQQIRGELGEKRFLLVLDDVWNCEQGLWNDLFTTLLGLSTTKGSWCILTTRLEPVANAVPRHLQMNDGPYSLRKLSDDECWSMVKEKVIAGEELPKELEAIQEQILRRCDGLPLAASLIGGLLLNNRKEKWHSIVQESLMNEYQSEIDQILKVSFDHLSPPSVKKCFAYCSIFPQDTRLEQDLLIELWMAEGFVQPDRQNQRMMEEIGGDYLRILLQNSLLEKVEESWGTYYKMHDLVHDFAKSVINPERSSQDRYLALNSCEEMAENVSRNKAAPLRTLFLHLESPISAGMNMLSRFKHLNVLKLSGDWVESLPTFIGELLHLRLLDISSSSIRSLPEPLCKLYNLQTLTMRDGPLVGGFPKRMSDLISLRHLNYYYHSPRSVVGDTELKMPTQMGQLTRLQTLKFFNISQERGCGIEELGTLKYLKGSLVIRNLGLVKGKEAAKQAKLFEKPNLSHLVFQWKRADWESDNRDDDVLEGLQPHPNLQILLIQFFMGNKFPQWFMNLSELVELRIELCRRCSELPSLGQLPSLKRLYLLGLDNIRSIGDEFYGITTANEEGRSRASRSSTRRQKFFSALEVLHVDVMENLVEWKDADQVRSTIGEAQADVFPMLRDLSISNCGNLRELPEELFGSSLQQVTIERCPRLISLGVNGQKYPLPCLEEMTICYCDVLELEGLQPHQNLQKLKIQYFMGNKFPQWFMNLSKLVELRIADCKRCSELPALGQLPSLKRFYLESLDNLQSIGDEFYGITITNEGEGRSRASGSSTRRRKFFPALEELHVTCMNNLVEWNDPEVEADVFPMLRDLRISDCPRLISLGVNGQKCPQELSIRDCKGLTTIPNKMFETCPSLRSLQVERCPNLVSFSLNLQGTPSLKEFRLLECPKLIPHRFKGFAFATSLRELRIGPFSSDDYSMDDFDWSGLVFASTLRELYLKGMPHTESLPHQLQYLTTLTSLSLYSFGGIEVLPDWIGNLVSLETLELLYCEKLQSLPSEAAMRRLAKLTRVVDIGCPQLRQQYNPQRGIYLKEEISSDPASSESEEEDINGNELAGRDCEPKSIDSAQTLASWCFPSLLKKKKKSLGESQEA